MKPITVTVGGQPLELQPPRPLLIWRLIRALRVEARSIDNKEDELPLFWGLLGGMVHPDPLPMSWDCAGKQPLEAFGGLVYDELRARGWTCAETVTAAFVVVRAVCADVNPPAAEVLETRDFSAARSDEAA